MGPATSLNFGATVTETPSTPASVVVTGSGPYNLTFHIPRGADGDMEPVGAWTLGNNYSAKQVVGHTGSSYVCKVNHTASAANEPGVGASWATDWDLFVSKGDQGIQGPAGPMDPAVYDPQAKHTDVFARANQTGTQDLSTITGFGVYAAKTSAYTAVKADNSGDFRFTAAAALALTAAATLGANWGITVTADGGDVTIDPSGSETINGQATLVVKNGTSCRIKCDGANFFAIMRTGLWELIADEAVNLTAVSGVAQYVKTGLDAFERIEITARIRSSAAFRVQFQCGSDNGATWLAGASDYITTYQYGSSGGSNGNQIQGNAFSIDLGNAVLAGLTTSIGYRGKFELGDFNKANWKNGKGSGAYQSSATATILTLDAGIFYIKPNAFNAIRILSDQSIVGRMTVMGVRG
jgi:hypothetical protein